jgi:hypothetical protein
MLHIQNTYSRVGRALSTVIVLGLLCAVVATANAQSTMPFREDFEGRGDGTVVNWDGWEPSDNSVVVQQSVYYDLGAQSGDDEAAYIPSESALTNDFGGVGVARVWTEMYVQPTLESAYSTNTPDVDASSTAFFYFNSNGNAKVWDGDHWEVLTTTAAGDAASQYTGGWLRVTVYQNYNTDTWSLFTNDTDDSTHMPVLLAENLDFNVAAGHYHHFALRNGTYLDMAYVDTYFPTNGSTDAHSGFDVDGDGDGSGDIWELHYYTSAGTYGAGSDTDGDGLRNEEEYDRGTDPTDAGSVSWIVPYYQTFETGANGPIAGTWKGVGITGTALIQSTDTVEGSRALCVSTGSVSYSVTTADANNDTNVWIQTFAKPAPYYDSGGTPAVDPDTAAAFFVQRGTGKLRMYSGSAWVYSDHVTTVPTNAWLGFSVHLDYVADKWSLYVGTNGLHGESMVRVTTNLLDFNSACTQVCFTAASIETELPTYLDAIAVSGGYDPVSALHTNVLVQERIANDTKITSLPPYEYMGEDREMDGALGDHFARGRKLKRALNQPDADRAKLLVSGTWRTFHLTPLAGWSGSGLDTYRATNSVAFDREPGTDFAVFYPFTNLVDDSYYDTTLDGTAEPSDGWSQASWPPTFLVRGLNPVGAGDTALPIDSFPEIWLVRDGQLLRFYYSTIRTAWMNASVRPPAESTITLRPGEGFWYRRRAAGSTLWQPRR